MPGRTTVVVVDAWPLVRLGIVRALQAADLRVVGEGAHGRDARQMAAALAPDLVVVGHHLDQTMADTVAELQRMDRAPRVMALVDQAAQEELSAILAAGATAIVTRSVTAEDLAACAQRALGGERVVAPALLPALVGMIRPADDGGAVVALTVKEREVLARLAAGSTNREIAEALFMAPSTVKTHLAHLYAKLGVRDRHQAIARAVALGILG